MKKIEHLNKILYTLIFTGFTTLIFVLNISQQNMNFYAEHTGLNRFVLELNLSIKDFDIMYVTLAIFIYYMYYQVYFDGKKLNKNSLINCVISLIITFTIIIGKSYKLDNTLGIIFNTPAQFLKCFLMAIGYYLMFYALLKKVTSLKIDIKPKKKNPRLEKIIKIIDKYHIIISIVNCF